MIVEEDWEVARVLDTVLRWGGCPRLPLDTSPPSVCPKAAAKHCKSGDIYVKDKGKKSSLRLYRTLKVSRVAW